jgi:hypothetical protein
MNFQHFPTFPHWSHGFAHASRKLEGTFSPTKPRSLIRAYTDAHPPSFSFSRLYLTAARLLSCTYIRCALDFASTLPKRPKDSTKLPDILFSIRAQNQ